LGGNDWSLNGIHYGVVNIEASARECSMGSGDLTLFRIKRKKINRPPTSAIKGSQFQKKQRGGGEGGKKGKKKIRGTAGEGKREELGRSTMG